MPKYQEQGENNNVEADENIEMKWKDNVRWNRNKRVDPFNHDEHGGKG